MQDALRESYHGHPNEWVANTENLKTHELWSVIEINLERARGIESA
jgi:hypothetical protein